MNEVYIVYAKRTPIGKYGGSLSSVRIDDLLSYLIKDFQTQFKFPMTEVDDVLVGCANQAGEDNRNIARMSSILAGMPFEVPGTTLNRLCGSSLDATIGAYARIKSGLLQCALVGGAESMSRAPLVMNKAHNAFGRGQKLFDTTIGWRFPNPNMEALFPLLGMGQTAEQVAKQYKISREQQDAFAFQSHQKAIQSDFSSEILPIEIVQKKGKFTFANDESIRPDTSLEKLQKLKPVFAENGSVTAGNSSPINDGAALLFLANEDFIKKHCLTPLAKIKTGAVAGVHPNVMGIGPVEAVKKLLKQSSQTIDNFDLVELNEAFAAQSLACVQELNIDPEKVNIRGGAIALGHPLGASGARILTTLTHSLIKIPSLKTGLASMCIGVGQGIAVSIEKV